MKRLKVTKNGKILARKAGQNHYNAKQSGRSLQVKRRSMPFDISNKNISRFITK
jgi:ribosomal protein L35